MGVHPVNNEEMNSHLLWDCRHREQRHKVLNIQNNMKRLSAIICYFDHHTLVYESLPCGELTQTGLDKVNIKC